MNWINIDKYLDKRGITYCEATALVSIRAKNNNKHMSLPAFFRFLLKTFHPKIAVRIMQNLVNTRQIDLEVKKRA